jgi:hypothetical protein
MRRVQTMSVAHAKTKKKSKSSVAYEQAATKKAQATAVAARCSACVGARAC